MPIAGMVAVAILGTAKIQAQGLSGPAIEDTTVELLLLDVLYNHLRLEAALPAVQDNRGHRFLPLRQLSSALGFRIHVEPAKRVCCGFLSNPSDRIALNGFTGRCVHKGKTVLFDSIQCFERDNDLYLAAEVVERIAGLHFDWRLNRLELDVSSDEPLAISQQWIQRRMLERGIAPQVRFNMPVLQAPYALWSLPSFDAQWYTDAGLENKVTQSTSRLQVEGRGDLLFMNARYRYVSGSGGEAPATLITLGRQDPRADLLGPLHATQFSLGDVNLPQLPLFARSRAGLGATFSNFPLPGSRMQAPAQIQGRAPAGSTVELYRGSEMLATVLADAQSNYSFSSVALEGGPNDLRVVVISPEGDVHEERRTLFGDASGPAPGHGQYRVTAAQVGDSLVSSHVPGVTADQRRREYIGEYQWGLSPSSWFAASLADTNGPGGESRFLGLGIHSWAGGNLVHVDTLVSGNGGGALSAGISRKLGDSTISLEHTLASHSFGAELIPEFGSDATSITKLRIDGSTGSRKHPISYGFGLDHLNGSDPSTIIRGRVSGGDGRTFLSNSFALRMSGAPMDGSGLLQIRRQFGSMLGRFEIGYGLGSEKALQGLHASIDRRISGDYRTRFGLDYDATRLSRLESAAAIYRMFGAFQVGLNLSVDTRGALKGSLLLSVGVPGDEGFHSLALARPGSAETGSVATRVYLDRNFDGRYDEGDLLLQNVNLKVGGRNGIARTGKDGICYVDRLASDQETVLTLNDESFEDPSWTATTPGVLVIPRSGRIIHLDLGVFEASEIEGRAEGLEGRQGLVAELVNFSGKVLSTSVLDDQGTYVFSKIWPGDYKLRLVDAAGQSCGERSLKVAPAAQMKEINLQSSVPKTKD
jgi:hypothetical protein